MAIKAYREAKLCSPDGTIIAALHYSHIPSEENDKVFRDPQSFVPGPPTNVQFMVKDSKNTPPRVAGDTHTSTKTVNRAPRRHSKPALLATRKLLATPSSPNTRPEVRDQALEVSSRSVSKFQRY